jgi:Bacterial membrane protein YfhO
MHALLRSWLTRIGRHEYVTAAALFGVLVVVFFSPVLTSDKTFSTVHELQQRSYPWLDARHPPTTPYYVQMDQAANYYPWEVLTYNSLREHGELPLWDPQSFAGHPFYANAQTGLAYPPRLVLARLFSPALTHDLYLMFHLWLGGLAMFALLKEFGARFAGPLLSGVAWSFSAFSAFWIQLENFAVVLALLPFVILCIHRWHARRSWRALAVGGLLLSLIFIGGSPEISLPCFVLASAYAACLSVTRLVAEWRRLPMRQRLLIGAAPGVLGIVGLAGAAVLLLPFLAIQSRSARPPFTLAENLKLSKVVPSDLLHTIVPVKLPLVSTNTAVFIGTIAGLLAIVGFFRRRPGAGLGRGIVIFLVLFFSVRPFQWLVYNAIPKLSSLGGLGRALFVWVFAVAILAGLGLDALVVAVRRRRRGWTADPTAPEARPASAPNGDDRLPWERWGAGLRRRLTPVGRAAPAVVAAVCVGVTATQLLVYMRDANPPFPPRSGNHLFPDTPAISAVREVVGRNPGRERVLPFTGPTGGPPVAVPLPWATPLALDLPSAGGYEASLPDDTEDLWRVVMGESLGRVEREPVRYTFGPYFGRDTRMDLLGRVGVAAVLTEPNVSFSAEQLQAWRLRETYRGRDGVVFEVLDRPGRAFVVDGAVRVDDAGQALRHFSDTTFDPRREVILEDAGDAGDRSPGTGGVDSGIAGNVRWVTDAANEIRLEVRSDRPAWLVVLDSWDPGWSASVDGRGVDIVQADHNFRAVRVPAGSSTVRMSFRPPGLVLGSVVSGVTVALIVAVLAFPPLRRFARHRSALRKHRERDGADIQDDRREQAREEEIGVR